MAKDGFGSRRPAPAKQAGSKGEKEAQSTPDNMTISFPGSGARPAARYVSATAVYEETLEHGRFVGLYWSASGQVQRENVTLGLPGIDSLRNPLCAFELEIDGQTLHNHWEWVRAGQRTGARPGTVEAVIELRHRVRPVTVEVVTRLDGTPFMARYLEITNTGAAPSALAAVAPLSGMLWNSRPPVLPTVPMFRLGYFAGEHPGGEGEFIWRPMDRGVFRVQCTLGKPYASPFYTVRNEATGEMFFIALAWNENLYAEFFRREGSLLFFKAGPLAPAPLRVIGPGETVTSPEVHIGPVHCRFDKAVSEWHRHMRSSVIPARPRGKEMYTLAGRVVEAPDEWILREIDIAAEMGVEAFMVDAGWYGEKFAPWPDNRGDWFEGGWLPAGLAGVRDYVHEKGMMFGLWHEPEAVSTTSRLCKEHPDWVLCTDEGRACGGVLDLANADAARFFEETVLRIVREYKPDFLKLDYNTGVGEGGQHLRDGYAENEAWRHHEVLYKVYDRVLKEFPHIALENCAGGGGRNTIGMLSRFHYCCESDISTFPNSIRAINSLSIFIPPEAICYYHNHMDCAHKTADLDTHLRVTLFATPIFVGFGAQNADRTTDYFKKTREYIELHKGFCRPVLAGHPLVYHHTPDIGLTAPADWCVLEYAAPDRSAGYAGVFKLSGSQGDVEYLLQPRGLDTNRKYQVVMHNEGTEFTATGLEITRDGIPVRLDSAFTSELLLFKAV